MQKLKKLKPNTKKSFFSKVKLSLFPEKTYLIRMQMRNGMHRSFTIVVSEGSFKYSGGSYVIDSEKRYYDIDQSTWCLDYHQDFSLPIHREISVTHLKGKVNEDPTVEVENAVDPSVLQTFLTSKVAEGVMRGQQIDDFLRAMRIMVAITMVSSIGHFIVYAFKSGMLNTVGF